MLTCIVTFTHLSISILFACLVVYYERREEEEEEEAMTTQLDTRVDIFTQKNPRTQGIY